MYISYLWFTSIIILSHFGNCVILNWRTSTMGFHQTAVECAVTLLYLGLWFDYQAHDYLARNDCEVFVWNNSMSSSFDFLWGIARFLVILFSYYRFKWFNFRSEILLAKRVPKILYHCMSIIYDLSRSYVVSFWELNNT